MGGIVVQLGRELTKPNADSGDLIRHMVFATLLSYKKKFGKQYGEMILCADGQNYWRKEYFPYYKGHRKHDRDKSALDWSSVFETIQEIKKELIEYFPYPLIEVEGAEGDDVIAILTKWLQENQLKQDGLFGDEPSPILILGADGDYVQLQKYKNVRQYSPLTKKDVKTKNVHEFLIEHICTGDGTDNVPNILTSDEWAKRRSENADEKIRQTPFQKKLFKDFYDKGIGACQNEIIKANYVRNQTLINFDFIPEAINKSVVDTYVNYEKKGSKMKLMGYFTKHRMKQLFSEVNNF